MAAEQRYNMQPVVPPKPRPKVGEKPAVAAKPSHLKKEPSFDKAVTDIRKTRDLVKQPSLNHMTPKLWVKAPSVHEPVHHDPPQRKIPPSPFGSNVWRPVHQIHTKPVVEKKLSNGASKKTEVVHSTLVERDEHENLSENEIETVKAQNNEKQEVSKPSNLRLRPTLSGPRTPIPYRPSFRRDAKSPGMGSLIKMWDIKSKETPHSTEPQQTMKQRLETQQGESWKSVSMLKKQSIDESNSSLDSSSARNAFRNRTSSIQFQSPKPYVNRSSAKNYKHPESTDTVIVCANDQTFAFDESAINKYSTNDNAKNSSVKAKSKESREENQKVESRMTTQEIFANADVAIYNNPSDSDSLEDNPGMNFATYEDFDESDTNITSAVYAVADDVPYTLEKNVGSTKSLQGYLPMSRNVPESTVEIRYEPMSKDVHFPSSNYGSKVVPPPAVQPKSTREYHEIDPNVPPPPDRDPPRLPPGVKPLVSSKSVDDSFPEDPPPLPPDNVVGRRSMMLTKEKKYLIVKDLNDKVNSGTKKLNYIDVEVSSNMGNNFTRATPQVKTNYTDVVVLSESEINTRDRSGSGTSEEGLSSVPRNKKKVKNKFQALFTSKENLNASPEKASEKEYMTDFEKERNKKKRISGRFLRKKKGENEKNKKEQRNSDVASRNNESDSGTFDLEPASSVASTNTSRSTSVVNSSSGGSTQSSGDAEVVATALHGDDRSVKWKVLPSTSPEHRRWSNEVTPSPSVHPRYRKSPSNPQMLPEGIYQDTAEFEIPPEPDLPKVTSFLHGANATATGGSETPPKPFPRQQSLPQVQLPPQHQENPLISPAPPRPPKSEIIRDLYSSESNDGGEAPPPIPLRDEYEYIEASNIVPPSPFMLDGTSKFLASEPLYQIYRNRTLSHASSKRKTMERAKSVKREEWKSEFNLEDLGTSTLWRNISEVVKSGAADGMAPEEIKFQQAQFEVVTSQASYLRSLNILVTHFMEDWAMESSDVLPTADRHVLFSNIRTVRSVEQKFLQDLEKHFWTDFKLTKVCELIAQYAKSDFDVYVRYIQNQTYQDRVLTKLQRSNGKFPEELLRLETSPACNKLPLLSFLLLPMQRVTRLPLLVTAIVNSADAAGDMKSVKRAKHALGVVNKLVKKCNEGARKMQQTEQLAEIASQLDYSPSVKMFALVSQSRNLVKKGEMVVTMTTESKKSGNRSKLWLFLFTDVLFIARKKSFMEAGNSTRYEVVNWSKRNLLYVNENAVSENSIFLVILEDQGGKRSEVTLVPPSQNELSRWTDALNPPKLGSTEESIYETWDCPQYTCVEPYSAEQPDELSIDVNDVMQIYKKTSDGWLEGERMRDGEVGWFPASSCEEIEDEHVRARNMKNMYKLLT